MGESPRQSLSVGNIVKADTTTLATLISVDPLLVAFDVDERTALRMSRLLRDKPAAAGRRWRSR